MSDPQAVPEVKAEAPAAAPPKPRVNLAAFVAGLLLVLPLLWLLFANIGRDPHAIDSPLIGKAAPEFTLQPLGGGPPVALSSFRGKVVVVNFWASWCGPCFQEHPVLVQAARSAGPDVQFVGIAYEDEEEKLKQFLRDQGQAYPTLLDPGSKTAMAYGLTGVPETFFVDAQGRIATKYVGPLQPAIFDSLLQKALVPAR